MITSPGGRAARPEGGATRPFTVNIEQLKPFHAHGPDALLRRPRLARGNSASSCHLPAALDMSRLFGEPELGSAGLGLTVRYLTPHSKWSIHSEYQDNLFMLSLSRGGPTMWMSPADAAKIAVRDNDWVEAVNRNGVIVCRAVVSHRMPDGVVVRLPRPERTIDVPLTETTGNRGGIHNSLTRLLVKPSAISPADTPSTPSPSTTWAPPETSATR